MATLAKEIRIKIKVVGAVGPRRLRVLGFIARILGVKLEPAIDLK